MNVIALTGPPAAGKSTVTDLLEDIGVPCKSTGNAIRERAHEQYDDPSEDEIWGVAEDLREKHGPAGPTVACDDWIDSRDEDVICVSDLREQAEADWLDENVGPTLVVRIDASYHTRRKRYVDREMEQSDAGFTASKKRERNLAMELMDRENRESPYPAEHVTIQNTDNVTIDEMWQKLNGLVRVVRA